MEVWKDVKGYEGLYLVSSNCRVKSIRTGEILKPTMTQNKAFKVALSKGGIAKVYNVARLAAIVFIPNPENKPCIDHIDGIRYHNFIENFRWCTIAENNNFEIARKNKLKYNQKIKGFGYDGKVVLQFDSYKQAVEKGFNRGLIKKSIETGKLYKGILYKYE
jgi:hypothetical protein